MQHCPFCGAPETERVTLDGARFLIFRCMFTPQVDPTLSEEELARWLARAFEGPSGAYFRGMCDTLHLYVTKGEGARVLTGGAPPPSGDP
ncbi:MAG TPA: hypothetical protein VLY85_02705 [Thermoplasmata archaeon]|nr:hypothetical protein [Thermoplasmata archaeon]